VSGAPPVVVTGASGLVGRRLVASLRAAQTPVRALSRRVGPGAAGLAAGVEAVAWDGIHPPPEALRGAGAVVHLAGEPLFGGRLGAARRRRVRASRVDSARAIAAGIDALPSRERPAVLVCASAVGYYGSRGDEPLPESAAPGEGFLARLCADWEAAAAGCSVRSVRLRIAVVLAREGGALPLMALPFRLGLGGRIGDGRQWFPWIHADDLVEVIRRALVDDSLAGALNAAAPGTLRNAELARALARLLHRPALLPVPALALRALLGELSQELLGSRRVVPRRLLDAGFAFAHPGIESALAAELAPGAGA
jgi:uncharacterized protein (TIGR01777 family)